MSTPHVLFTIKLQTKELNKIDSEDNWLNHEQFSPVDPELLLYGHEGRWDKVDRSWLINVKTKEKKLLHRRAVKGEINGHEWWRADEWSLDLGKMDVSARVKVNGHDAGVVWSVTYQINIGRFLKKGENHLSIEVTNLPANRIADYDQKGIPWKIFYDINVVNLDYKPLNASDWKPLPSGLTGPVQLIPLKKMGKDFK